MGSFLGSISAPAIPTSTGGTKSTPASTGGSFLGSLDAANSASKISTAVSNIKAAVGPNSISPKISSPVIPSINSKNSFTPPVITPPSTFSVKTPTLNSLLTAPSSQNSTASTSFSSPSTPPSGTLSSPFFESSTPSLPTTTSDVLPSSTTSPTTPQPNSSQTQSNGMPTLETSNDFNNESTYLDTQQKSLQTSSDAIDEEQATLTKENVALQTEQSKMDPTNQADIDKYNSMVNQYNAGVKDYQSKIATFNTSQTALKARQDNFNANVAKYNQQQQMDAYASVGGAKIGPEGKNLTTVDPNVSKNGWGALFGAHTENENNPDDINVKVPFTNTFITFPPFSLNYNGIKDPTLTPIENFISNLPSAVIQAIPRALVTVAETFGNMSQSTDKTLGPIESALYGDPVYKSAYADIQDRIANGDGVLSAVIGAISNKVLDVAFGAGTLAEGLTNVSKLLASDSPYAEIEAYKTLGSPTNEEELKSNYRALSQQFHPDKMGGDGTAFKIINDANMKLKNPDGTYKLLPSVISKAKNNASRYAEWAGRQTKINDPIFALNTKINKDANVPPKSLPFPLLESKNTPKDSSSISPESPVKSSAFNPSLKEVRDHAQTVSETDLGENPDPKDLQIQAAAKEFNDLPARQQGKFYQQRSDIVSAQGKAIDEHPLNPTNIQAKINKIKTDRGLPINENPPVKPVEIKSANDKAGINKSVQEALTRVQIQKAGIGEPKIKNSPEVSNVIASKVGEVKDAFNNPEIGKVDAIWGRPSVPGQKGYGLGKIKSDHPEVLPHLTEAMANAKVVEKLDNRDILETQGPKPIRIIVDHQLGTEPKTFLNNAYFVVPRAGIEPATSPFSGERSTSELPKRGANIAKGKSYVNTSSVDKIKSKFGGEEKGIIYHPDEDELNSMRNEVSIDYDKDSGIAHISSKEEGSAKKTLKSSLVDAMTKGNKKTVKSKAEVALGKEALKYKTAEEFVNSITHDKGGIGSSVEYSPLKRFVETSLNDTPLTEFGFKPDEMVTIYRGVDNANQRTIKTGDYIATSHDLASSYTDGNVISKEVPASSVRFSSGDGITADDFKNGFDETHLEGVYNPDPLVEESQLKDIWNEAHNNGGAAKKNIFSKLSGPKMDAEKARQIINQVKALVPEKDLDLIFTNGEPITTASGKIVRGAQGYFEPASKPFLKSVITLYEEGGKVNAEAPYHEAGHFIFKYLFSETERRVMLDAAKRQMGSFEKLGYKALGYKGEDVMAEEHIMNEYAKQKADEDGFHGPLKKFLNALDTVIKHIVNTVKKVAKAINDFLPENGRQGGFANFLGDIKDNQTEAEGQVDTTTPVQMSTEARKAQVNEAIDRISDSKDPAEIKDILTGELNVSETEAGPLSTRLSDMTSPKNIRGAIEGEEARIRRTPNEALMASLPESLQQRATELEVQRDNLNQNPAKKLVSNMSHTGEFAGHLKEVTGEGTSQFGKSGDSMATELGYPNSEAARDALDKYNADKEKFAEAQKQFRSDLKEHIRSEKAKISSKKSAEKAAALKRAMEETARVADELKYKASLSEKIKAEAKRVRSEGEDSWWKSVKRGFNPLRYQPTETRDAFENWHGKMLGSTELAQDEFNKFDKPEMDDMKTIHAYQAGMLPKAEMDKISAPFDAMYKEGHDRGINLNYRKNYLPQVYVESDPKLFNEAVMKKLAAKGMDEEMIQAYMAGEELPAGVASGLKLTPFFSKERVFDSYAEAEQYGLHPLYKNIPSLAAHYRMELEKIVANKELIEELADKGKIGTTGIAPSDWVNLNARGFKDYKASPSLARMIDEAFRDEGTLSGWQKTIKFTANLSTKIQHILLSTGVPFTNLHFYGLGQAYKSIETMMGSAIELRPDIAKTEAKVLWSIVRSNFNGASTKFFEDNKDIIKKMAANGIDVGNRIGSFEDDYKQLDKSTLTKRVLGPAAKIYDRIFTRKMFASTIPQMYITVFKDVYGRALQDGLEDEDAQKLAAQVTKNQFGISSLTMRSRNVREEINTLFMAPKYRESLLKIYLNGGKGFKFKDATLASARAFIYGSAIMYGIYNVVNYKINGYPMWDNPAGRGLYLRIPMANGQIMYIPYGPSIFAVLRNVIEGAGDIIAGHIGSGISTEAQNLSIPAQVIGQILTNTNFYGNEIYNENDSEPVKLAKITQYTGEQFTPQYLTALLDIVENKNQPLYQTIMEANALPVSFSTTAKEATSNLFDAVDQQTADNYQAKNKAEDLFAQWSKLPSTQAYANLKALQQSDPKTAADMQTIIKQSKSGLTLNDRMLLSLDVKTGARANYIYNSLMALPKDQRQVAFDALKQKKVATPTVIGQVNKLAEDSIQDTPPTTDASGTPQYADGQTTGTRSILQTVATYAEAIGTSPEAAFHDIFTGQTIKQVYNPGIGSKYGAVIVDRMSFNASMQQKLADTLQTGTNMSDMKLDHAIPLEAGGTNDADNLQLIPTAQWSSNTPIENFLAQSIQDKKVTADQAKEIAIRYKAGQGEPLSPALMEEYANDYGSKPMSAQDVYDLNI